MNDSQKKVVVITRRFPAGIERLWRAFTTEEDMLKWHSPVGMTNPSIELDLRVGGRYAIAMEYDETGEVVTVRGVYKIIEKPNPSAGSLQSGGQAGQAKLVYSWKWDRSDMETVVSIQFRKISDDETEVILTQSGFDVEPTEVDLENNWTSESHSGGWTTAFDKLAKIVAK